MPSDKPDDTLGDKMKKFEAEDEKRIRAKLGLEPMAEAATAQANTAADIPHAAVKFDADKPAYHLLDRQFVHEMRGTAGDGRSLNDTLLQLRSWSEGEAAQLKFAFGGVAGAFNTATPWLTAELELARVLAFGAAKYDAHNWRKGFVWSRLYRAATGHIRAHQLGDIYDSETGLLHLSHALCCLMFLIVHERDGLGTDDREEMIR